ncbi:MAG TPA: response regulator transcription factor [Kofleriaceae bacterium]
MRHDILALLVEDDERLARFTAEFLEQHEVGVTIARDGDAALIQAHQASYDIVILDLMLPRRDGLAVCRALRGTSDVPILIVTARSEEADRIVGLELGADDYLSKPFSARELLARIRALVRRARGQLGPASSVLRAGALELKLSAMTVSYRGRPVELTSYEFTLLRILVERAGRVLSRDQLLELAKGTGQDDAFDRSIDVRISKLRHKLGAPALIRTVRGAGYVLTTDDEPAAEPAEAPTRRGAP